MAKLNLSWAGPSEALRQFGARAAEMARNRVLAKWALAQWMIVAAVFALFAPRLGRILDLPQDDADGARRAA
jgi:hypothetical protein